MTSWICVKCNKQEETRWYHPKPKWVYVEISDAHSYKHMVWQPKIIGKTNPWDYGHLVYCGDVLTAKKRQLK